MAKRDSFYRVELVVEYTEKGVCAYEDGDETFHTIHHESDDDFGSIYVTPKEAYVKAYELAPAETKLRNEFYDVMDAQKEALKSLRDAFSGYTSIEEPKLEKSRIEFCDEKCVGELTITLEEYDILSKLDHLFNGGRDKFVLTGNGKTFCGVVGRSDHFNWAQLRSSYNPREISGASFSGWNSFDKELFDLFYEIYLGIVEELL